MIYLIDLTDILDKYLPVSKMQSIYRKYPLRTIVGDLLQGVDDYEEWIWWKTTAHIGQEAIDDMSSDEIENIQALYTTLVDDLDRSVAKAIGGKYDCTRFMFDKWVDSITVSIRELRYEGN